jgi:hypothetical protein
VTTAAGLRSIAKAMELPPTPTVRAPALDPTCERLGVRPLGATHLSLAESWLVGRWAVIRANNKVNALAVY